MNNKERSIIPREMIDQYKDSIQINYLKEIENNLNIKTKIKSEIKDKLLEIKTFFKSNKLMYFIILIFIIILIFWYMSLHILKFLSNI